MHGNAMLGKDMEEEQFGQLRGCDGVVHGDENTLLREVVYDNQNGRESRGSGELFNEVHRDGIPWAFGNQKLLQQAIWLVAGDLGMGASGA